ncbi:MAG: ankyrin repeat domain-containing protein [Desulfobacterales bacterium]|nr:ankyrin repeat domain-containing protein [Desulfobacterales bacterium]
MLRKKMLIQRGYWPKQAKPDAGRLDSSAAGLPTTCSSYARFFVRVSDKGPTKWGILKLALMIAVSLSICGSKAFTADFKSPEMTKPKQDKFERPQKIAASDREVDKMFSAVYENDVDTVLQQLEKGVNVNARDDTGQTPLHITQNKAMAEMLIKKSADVNAVDPENMTPIFNKEIELSKILVEAGADINFKSKRGNTPIIWYAYSGYTEGIQYLVSLGASVNVKNSDGQTAYDVAEKFSHFNLLEYLKSIGAQKGYSLP